MAPQPPPGRRLAVPIVRARDAYRAVPTLGASWAVATCPGCNAEFSSEDSFRSHVSSSSCEASQCRICRVVFSCVEELVDHCENSHGTQGVRFAPARKARLSGSVPRSGDETKEMANPHVVNCPGCDRWFPNEASLRVHATPSRPACTVCSCPGCCILLGDELSRETHMQTCTKTFRCPGCSRIFTSNTELKAHVARVARTPRRLCQAVACIGCGMPFGSAAEAAVHEESCWSVLQCPGCDNRFGAPGDFHAHVERRRQNCSATSCVCGLVFGSLEEQESCGCDRAPRRRLGRRLFASTATGKTHSKSDFSPGLMALPPPPSTAEPGVSKMLPSVPTLQLKAEEALRDVDAEVAQLRGAALRGCLRRLQLQWHPDQAWRAHVEDAVACQVFGFVQQLWKERVLGQT